MDMFVLEIRLFRRPQPKPRRTPANSPSAKERVESRWRPQVLRGFARFNSQIRLVSSEFIDLVRQYRYELTSLPASEPLAQAVEHLPFKQRVAGSNPARLTSTSPSSSLAQDTGLSRRRHGFKSRRGRQ